MSRISITILHGCNEFTSKSVEKSGRTDRPIGIELTALFGEFKTLAIEIRSDGKIVEVDIYHVDQKGAQKNEALKMPFGTPARSRLARAIVTAMLEDDKVALIFTQE
jgi:hypothetical protein